MMHTWVTEFAKVDLETWERDNPDCDLVVIFGSCAILDWDLGCDDPLYRNGIEPIDQILAMVA